MTLKQRHIIASYNISDPLRLNRVAKVMKDYGERVLKSVFECVLDEERYKEMKRKIEDLIEREEDSVRYYFICDKCLQLLEYLGKGEGFKEDDAFTVI